MELRISNRLNQPNFQRLIWNEKHREKTQYAISEIMRQDSSNTGSISFNVLKDQFDKIDSLKEDVILNCSYFGSEVDDYNSGIFSIVALNKSGATLADLSVGINSEPKSGNDALSKFYSTVKKRIKALKSARELTQEQKHYYKSANNYMKSFDKKA